MAETSIPVDVFNPGQVLACMGFLEAADVLLGDAEGGFEWKTASPSFILRASGERNPIEVVLGFLAEAQINAVVPEGWAAPEKQRQRNRKSKRLLIEAESNDHDTLAPEFLLRAETFSCPPADTNEQKLAMRLPVQLSRREVRILVSHWADGSSRNDFKLYSGNRSAFDIARKMIVGATATNKRGEAGEVENLGIAQLWRQQREELISAPFDVLTPLGGSFNFDPRGAWTAIDAGYSPNDQGHGVVSSPVVEILAAIGLEHSRPEEFSRRKVRYAVWRGRLPTVLARAAFAGCCGLAELRRFQFDLDLAGKNKVITFAHEEPIS